MKAILLKAKNIDKEVIELIYDKQHEFRKEKNMIVSLERTVNRLLKEAYLKKKKEDIHVD